VVLVALLAVNSQQVNIEGRVVVVVILGAL